MLPISLRKYAGTSAAKVSRWPLKGCVKEIDLA